MNLRLIIFDEMPALASGADMDGLLLARGPRAHPPRLRGRVAPRYGLARTRARPRPEGGENCGMFVMMELCPV